MKNPLLIIILLLTINSYAQENKCSDFKVGKFTYSDPDYADLITIRNDSIQIDSYPKMGWEMTSKVEWLTDCKYEILYIKVNDSKMESLIGIKYVIEIIEIDNNKIICRTESEGITVEKEMIKTETE
jgi:hypothetical protein